MIEHLFVLPITVAQTTRDKHGDLVPAGQVTVNGWFLERQSVVLSDLKEETNTNAIAWLPPTTTVTLDSIIVYNGIFYRIINIVRAKCGGSANIEFIKCYVQTDTARAGIS